MAVDWCLDVLKRAISQLGFPEIINSDKGSQYTSSLWQSFMEQNGIQISMDGKFVPWITYGLKDFGSQ